MDKANIIISIIIVLCIAAAVAAYGITNSNNSVFTNLAGMDSNDDTGDGLGNNTTISNTTNTSSPTSSQSSNNGGQSSSGSSSKSGSSVSSSSGGSGSSSSKSSQSSGSSSSSKSSSSGSHSSSSGTHLSKSTAQSIANGAVEEPGCYAGSVSYSGGYWYCKVYNSNGTVVSGLQISDSSGSVSLY